LNTFLDGFIAGLTLGLSCLFRASDLKGELEKAKLKLEQELDVLVNLSKQTVYFDGLKVTAGILVKESAGQREDVLKFEKGLQTTLRVLADYNDAAIDEAFAMDKAFGGSFETDILAETLHASLT
jgi:hypothetical protein